MSGTDAPGARAKLPRLDNHKLPRLATWWKLVLTLLLSVGWFLFFSAWFASMMAAGWGLTLSIFTNLGELLESQRQTTPKVFWFFFALHAVSLPVINSIAVYLVRRIALPRGFRTTMRLTAIGLAILDITLWILLPHLALARATLAWVLLLETVVLAALGVLPIYEMWFYTRWKGADQPKRVVIVGGGFGGLYAALNLDAALGYHDDLEIVVMDKKNYFLFPPLLPSVATGAIESRQVTNPFRRIFEATNIVFKKQEVLHIDLGARRIHSKAAVAPDPVTHQSVTITDEIEYDYLVLAPGASTNTFNVPGADKYTFYMRELGDAIAVRNHVIDCFEHAAGEKDPVRRERLLNFVVVGAGPTGVELAAEIQDLIQHVLLRRYPEIDPTHIKVHLVQSGQQVLPGWHDMVADKTAMQLTHINVNVVLGSRVVGVGPDSVTLKNGEVIYARTVVWCTGVKPAAIVAKSGLPITKRGQVHVGPDLRVPGHDNVFVLGDVAECLHPTTEKPLPALAQVAFQQGKQCAPNIIRLLKGRQTRPFKYFDYGALICVGEHFAVVDLMGVRFSGFFAWVVWRSLYVAKLVGVGNRVRVLLDWTLDLMLERSLSQLWSSRTEVPPTTEMAPESPS